jgi:6-phosphogluconolactonase (cycloisomerase 2 family)
MGMKVAFFAGLLALAVLGLLSCSTTSSSSSGTGALFVTTQGDNSVSAFSVALGTGALTANGNSVATDKLPLVPTAMILAPSGNALFVANSNPNIPTSPPCTLPPTGTVNVYTVNSDGTLTAANTSTPAGIIPSGMAIDSAGKHLFVANQGIQCSPKSGTISVFNISGTTLSPTPGSPFITASGSAQNSTRPVAVAVSLSGNFLYVANQFDGTVSVFSTPSSGALTTPLATYPVGMTPSALTLSPDGSFLYVANSGSGNVNAFTVCDKQSATCAVTPGSTPDGSLSPIAGSPFPAALGPISITTDSAGRFLFVVDNGSNQVSQYKISAGTGVLVADSPATISTGDHPVWVSSRAGTTTVSATGGTIDYLYVANIGANTISTFSFDSTIGGLSVSGTPVTLVNGARQPRGQPSAIAVK